MLIWAIIIGLLVLFIMGNLMEKLRKRKLEVDQQKWLDRELKK